jgi:type II secretory pathway pseudopilin PulG
MTRRMPVVVLATTFLVLLLAAAAPRPARAVSFVDKQVQAGALLIQNYVNTYGQAHQFVYPPKKMVKKGGGLPNSTVIWPSNPWTGRIMGPGSSRGTYTYKLGTGDLSYRLIVHLSRGNYVLKSAMPSWFKSERNTAAKQDLLLLQRYLDAYKTDHGDYPATGSLTPQVFADPTYVWPQNPWTGSAMTASDALGDFSYTRVSSSDFTLRVKLTSGWSDAFHPVSLLSNLTVTPGG